MNLFDIKEGEKVTITSMNGLQDRVRRRLQHLGLMEGSEICYQCKVPFGGPCILATENQKIGIRRKDAACIQVRKSC
ncbi:ferrous iron transport protein A [Melghiribacillus thermohalophilus]|uniref:Ferrous iron transport protein A n=1 Tax=Melghiribacillus thermohalophilus TaxID=1324956 RepID=A0A4R3MZ09_9BACI|nr:FeoA family protein [Melghiribacillus thermohalophilus]TCT20901.1 ferrous iron transport protein A [Melghiribacillus thermohalophilus]